MSSFYFILLIFLDSIKFWLNFLASFNAKVDSILLRFQIHIFALVPNSKKSSDMSRISEGAYSYQP
jgi:hypothetical protein